MVFLINFDQKAKLHVRGVLVPLSIPTITILHKQIKKTNVLVGRPQMCVSWSTTNVC